MRVSKKDVPSTLSLVFLWVNLLSLLFEGWGVPCHAERNFVLVCALCPMYAWCLSAWWIRRISRSLDSRSSWTFFCRPQFWQENLMHPVALTNGAHWTDRQTKTLTPRGLSDQRRDTIPLPRWLRFRSDFQELGCIMDWTWQDKRHRLENMKWGKIRTGPKRKFIDVCMVVYVTESPGSRVVSKQTRSCQHSYKRYFLFKILSNGTENSVPVEKISSRTSHLPEDTCLLPNELS